MNKITRIFLFFCVFFLLFLNYSYAQVIPQTNWSLLYVDSEELIGENGAATNAFDGNTSTLWHTKWFNGSTPLPHEIQIDLGATYDVSGFRYLPRQDGGVNGRIGQYEFYVSTDGINWGTAVATGTFANSVTEKEVLFAQTTAQYIRLRALTEVNGNPWTSMAEISVLGSLSSGNQAPNGVIDTPGGNLTINVGDSVNFTGTGTDLDNNTPLTYLWDFGDPAIADSTQEDPGSVQFNNTGVFTVTFTVTDALGLSDPTPATRTITVQSTTGGPIPKTGWSLLYVDSEELIGENGAATNAFDGNTSTLWHTKWFNGSTPLPHEIQIDLGATYDVSGFRYLPRQDGGVNGRIGQYEFYVSTDGINWGTAVATGTFANSVTEKEVLFAQTTAQYIRLRALTEVNGNPWTSMAEINVLGSLSSGNQAPNGVIDTPGGNLTISVGDSVNFTGTGTDLDNNTPLTYLWDFGDPAIADSTQEDPGSVQFNNTGVFTVTFTVTDALGLADPTPETRTITVNTAENQAPDGAIDTPNGDITIDAGSLVNFTGTGTDPDNNIPLTYLWNFGDPAIADSTQEDPGSVQFNNTGTFTVTFTVTDALGLADPTPATRVIIVQSPPEENQAPNGLIDTPSGNLTITIGDSINFTGTGTDPDNNTPLTYLWNFGDPALADSTQEDPGLVQFNNTGTFTVTFTVTDVLGLSDPTPATRTITVNTAENQAPDGAIDTPNGDITIDAGSLVNFTGTGTDPDNNIPLTYLWNFGDPAIADSTQEDPGSVQFNNIGTFTVTFTITDALGLSDPTPATRTITVQSTTGGPIPKTGWSLLYVDSEELVGENGAATNAFDGNTNTLWHTQYSSNNPPHPHEIQINLGNIYNIHGFRYLPRQDNSSIGQINFYEFYVSNDGTNWDNPVVTGAFVDDPTEKEVLFTPMTGQFVRLKALNEVHGFVWTSMAEINVLGNSSSNQAPNGVINTPSWHTIINVGDSVDFSGTGTDPDNNTPLTYQWNFGDPGIGISTAEDPGLIQFNNPGTFVVTFTVTDALGRSDPIPAVRVITASDGSFISGNIIPQTYWNLWYVDSEEHVGEDGAAANAFDGNTNTLWHTKWLNGSPPLPHEIQIDLGAIYNISGFRYSPRQDGGVNGRIGQYEFYASSDGINWGNPVIGGTFVNDGTEKEVLFNQKTAQFIRLRAATEVNGNPWTSIAEINVLHQCSDPSVQILQPSNYHVQPPGNLFVSTAACLDTDLGVKFTVDGGSANGGIDYLVYSPPFEANFSNLSLSEHIIETFVVDALGNPVSGNMTYDKATQVGIGDYYVAAGNSNTFGVGDDDSSDDESTDGRNTGGGYTPILNNLLTLAKNYPHTVVNEGVPGDKTINGLSRIPSLLEKYPYAQHYLVQYGTNDSGGLLPVPSGKGLNPGDSGYPGSFKDRMQQIITLINNAGKEVCLAKVPFTLVSTARNTVIQDYNIVIDELKGDATNNISVTPPDFYTYFEAHQEEFFDELHPNGTGYRSMANLWFTALSQ